MEDRWKVRLRISLSGSNNNFLASHHAVRPNKFFGRSGEEDELNYDRETQRSSSKQNPTRYTRLVFKVRPGSLCRGTSTRKQRRLHVSTAWLRNVGKFWVSRLRPDITVENFTLVSKREMSCLSHSDWMIIPSCFNPHLQFAIFPLDGAKPHIADGCSCVRIASRLHDHFSKQTGFLHVLSCPEL